MQRHPSAADLQALSVCGVGAATRIDGAARDDLAARVRLHFHLARQPHVETASFHVHVAAEIDADIDARALELARLRRRRIG